MTKYDVGKGWNNLIACLELELERATGEKPEPSQVKEKFGGLRYYISGGEEVQSLVHLAERLSYSICEECGNKGVLREFGWFKTLCKDCWLKDLEGFNDKTKEKIIVLHREIFK